MLHNGKGSTYGTGTLGLRNVVQSVTVVTTTKIEVRMTTHIQWPNRVVVDDFPEVVKSTDPLDCL
jgi:hypothetical protein